MFRQKFFLTAFFIYNLFSVLLIVIGVWPDKIVYLNLAIQLLAVLCFDLEHALYSVVLSIPFYLAIPKYDSMSEWRFVFAFLFAVFLVKRYLVTKTLQGLSKEIRFFVWDKYFLYFLAVAALSILFEPFKTEGLKKLLFVVNIYLLYFVAVSIIRSKDQILRFIKVNFISLATIVLLGFAQYFSTLATSTYYFWQYWAVMVSKAYYGLGLANTLIYSNSWFSFYPNQPPSLRMFSILPDSHAFALIAMFAIPFAAALLYFSKKTWQKMLLWLFIALSALAITFSGTRGVWAGIAVPIVLLLYFYAKRNGRPFIRPMFWPILLFFLFLVVSPLVQKISGAANNKHNYGNFIERASTIYDIQESSNAGRLHIWLSTLKFDEHHLLLGTGFGNFIITLQPNLANTDYQQLASQNQKEFNLPKKFITAHDLYLDTLTETGIIGLFFFALYFYKVLQSFWIFFKKYQLFIEDGLVFFVVNFGVYIVWLLAYSVFDGTFYNDRVLMYFFLALAASASIMFEYNSR